MEIYDSAGTLILSVVVDDDSYRYKAIMGDNELTLKYALAEHVELPLGSYCDYQSERYYLIQPENLKEVHSRDFEYTVSMQTVQAYAKLWKFRNPVDGRLKFPLTAKPKEHLQMFVDNMNSRDKGWTIGECIDGTETLINYDHAYCLDALKQMADTFNTEFEINGRQVSLRKVEYNKQQPLALSYGRGKGFKTGVARENSSNNPPVEILFVQGGTQNIDASKYGSSELMLPADGEIGYDGSKFSDEDGFVSTAARWYKVDSDRRSLRRRDKQLTSRAEDSVDLSSIYPKRVGTISEVVTVDKDKNFYDIIDNTIPDSLDYSACLIEGETMTIIFQSGELSGREFDVKYYPAVKDNKKAKRFEIVPAEQDGQVMPGGTFLPVVGDTYAVFHCQLPQAYINDAKTKSGAEWDMFREAVRYMYEHEETEFTFTGDLDGIWSKKDWENIGGRIKLGGYISFSDARFQKEGVLVRITGIKDYINSPHSPEIELSNKTVSATVGSRLQQLEAASVTVEEKHRDAISFTKRRFRDAQETASMLEKALLDNYTNSINPITVRTMQLLVGDESLQFRFVNSRTAPVEEAHQFTYDKATKQLTTAAGTIQHMTLGIKDLSSKHKPSEYKFWSVNSYSSAVLDDATKKYYLYIKAAQTADTAEFLLSEQAIKIDAVSGYYHFLCGVLNSEYDGDRSFATLYGFSEVLPGRVTTDRVVSGDGLSYFDMVANAMKLGDRLRFNVDGDGKLVLNGTLVQRGGEEQPIIMYRGQWLASVAYAVNDVVFYIDSDNKVSSYICIKATTVGVKPTDTEYWETFAQGIKGDHGGHFIFVYCLATQTPTKPNYTQYPFFTLNGEQYWQTTPPSGVDYTHFLYMSYAYVDDTTGQIGAWSSPVRISGENGETGKDGSDIEFIYRRNTINSCAAPTNNASADDYIPTGWTDNPTGVDATYQYEFVCVRVKERGADVWGNFSSPALWAKWGEKGQDGDGVEYIFSRTTSKQTLSAPMSVDVEDYVPDGWTDEPSGVSVQYPYEYVSIRHKTNGHWGSFSTPQLWSYYAIVKYTEIRFAKNGSTTTPPTLDKTSANPTGWTTSQPSVGTLEYLWMTVAQKQTDGTLVSNWSDPVRVTPKDGTDGEAGKSPALVFRGVYDSTKLYYGNQYRVDAVKYNSVYYVARIDAGEFKGVAPTNTSKWNEFGAQFESIATNLLLAEGANIGDWFLSGGQIVSTLDGSTLIILDAKTPKILLQSTQTGGNMGDYNKNMNTAEESTISLDAQNGQVEARSNDGVAYMTANGVFCNHAQTNALPASTGYTHYGSVVGLGFAKVNKSSWAMNEDETIVTGVYGRADNSGTAPSYGGYFNQLKAAGFSKGVYYFTDSDNNHQLSNSNATVVGLVNKKKTNTLYLPRNAHEGEEIEVIQMGQGTVRVDTNDGTHLYDDDSENDYYDIGCGYTGVFRKVKYSINDVTYDIWTVGVYKF